MSARLKLYSIVISVFVYIVVFSAQSTVSAQTRELLLGVEPEHNIFDQVENYRTLSKYLSDKLDVQINLTIMSRFGEITKRFKTLHLDGAFLSSYTAALSIHELGLEPVASPVALGGESTSRGYIIVRKDSGIKTISDMKGKSIVYVDSASTEGYVFPLSQVNKNGTNDPDGYFSHSSFSGSHASAIFAVLDSRADIGAVKDTAYMKVVKKDPSIENELTVIATSPDVPETTLCVRSELDVDLRQKLEKALLNMDKNDQGKKVLENIAALRFVKTGKDNFGIITKMAGEAGITLSVSGNR